VFQFRAMKTRRTFVGRRVHTFFGMRRLLAVLASSAALSLLAGPAVAHKPNPETDNRKPDQDAGYFVGYPSPTYSWHGCTKFSTQRTPATLDEGVPDAAKANAQNKVSWKVTTTSAATAGYVVSWKVADGWKICGAQAEMLGSDPSKSFDLAMEAGYTSKAGKGSTVASGGETIRVKLSKRDAEELGVDATYAGDYAISKIYALYVFVKKDKRGK
jgi:hypothetical protein